MIKIGVSKQNDGNYYAYFNNKKYSFNTEKRGEWLARKLAEESFKLKKRVCNYIEEIDNETSILYLNSNKNGGLHEIYIDTEDVDKIKDIPWSISKKSNGYYVFYAKNSTYIHRIILGIDDPNIIIDHIDRNPKNNKKNNLRITNHSGNKRNLPIKSNNTSGIKGVRYDKNRQSWIMEIRDLDGKRIRKSFSCRKYGEEKAKQMAIEIRKQLEKEYEYIN